MRWLLRLLPPLLLLSIPFMAQEPRDSDRLGMALEYFQSAKYHEALLIFEKLDKEYSLNPRYHAYMGICYYHEWLYEEACQFLDEAIPQLEGFAPHERSVYYYTDGESHFQLQQYEKAIPYFERALTVCYENEKGDIYYRIGLCQMFLGNWQSAYESYKSALDNYLAYRNNEEMTARIHQTAHMMKGCESHLKKDDTVPADSVSFATEASGIPADSVSFATEAPGIPADSVAIIANETATPSDSMTATVGKPAILSIPSVVTPSIPVAPPPINATVAVRKDTIRSVIPQTVNIQELYEQKTEMRE